MPADDRMSLTNILTEEVPVQPQEQLIQPYGQPQAYPKTHAPRTLMRPSLSRHRMHSSQAEKDPWDYNSFHHNSRSNSSYSIYSNASASSLESAPSTSISRNPGLERHDSSDSCQSIPISPVTPIEPSLLCAPVAIVPSHASVQELAAGAALTSMRSQPTCVNRPTVLTTYPSSPYMATPTSPVHEVQRSQSPRSLRDANGNRMYPCPLASSFRCEQHFSTSGHARRHSRIHTGERGAECPECGQKFSRQDNMQQHRRTHRNGRDGRRAAAPAVNNAASKTTGSPELHRSPLAKT